MKVLHIPKYHEMSTWDFWTTTCISQLSDREEKKKTEKQKGGIEPATWRVSAWSSTTSVSDHTTWHGCNEDYICIFIKWASMGSQYLERRRVHFYLVFDAPRYVDTITSSLVSLVSYWLYSCVFILPRSCHISLRIIVASPLFVYFLTIYCL